MFKRSLSLSVKTQFSKNYQTSCAKGWTLLTDSRLIRQVDGCVLGEPISVVLSEIFRLKMELDAVKPLSPKSYKFYVIGIYQEADQESTR